MSRRLTVGTVLVAGALALAACGGDAEGEAPEGDGGLTSITVGVIPIGDTAPAWLGLQEGIFEEHGLDVEIQVLQGGAAVIPGVLSGDIQFGFSNTTSLLIAADQGLGLSWVAPAASTTGDVEEDFSAVMTMPGSGISSPSDLEGRTVAVNTLNNIGDTVVRSVVEADGGDPDAVEFVELAFPDMPAALTEGRVEAAWVLDPFMTMLNDEGAESISRPYAEVHPELMVAAYFTSEQLASSDPEVIEAFQAAMQESLTYAEEHPDEARAVLSEFTEIAPEVREAIVLPRWPSEFAIESIETLADLAYQHGLLEEEVAPESLLY
ncbi:ABC transporter substrate-binding protein [Georgenia sp. Z1491]|uniref:ABC transporter substrate-binding protein n=1 Tax=Georgenia sp. Z1491 TaxID=3416707 RepID=UPI003CEF8988